MAADKRQWVKMDVGYLDNPKVSSLLDDHPRAIILHMFCIAYSKQHRTDGRVPMRQAMRRACSEQCDVHACASAGILSIDGDDLIVHDYIEHQGTAEENAKTEKTASLRARRAAEARWRHARKHAQSNAPSMQNGCLSDASSMQRREEKSNTSSDIASDPDADPSDEIKNLCQHLADWIERNGNKRPTVGKRWYRACRLLIEVDGRTADQIRTAIDWSQKDPFWSSNILSMAKLREKYDTLRAQAGRSGNTGKAASAAEPDPLLYWTPPEPPSDFDGDIREWAREQTRLERQRRGIT